MSQGVGTAPYVVWRHAPAGNSCLLDPPEGIERDWQLGEGVSRAHDFPTDALFRMSDDHPRNVSLSDNLMNLAGLVVVSERVAALLAARELRNLELLRVAIVDHRGRIASDRFFIVNPTEPQDCLDHGASQPRFSPIVPSDIVSVDQLAIDLGRVDPALLMFRIKNFWPPMLIRRDLAEALLASGAAGLAFTELHEYGG